MRYMRSTIKKEMIMKKSLYILTYSLMDLTLKRPGLKVSPINGDHCITSFTINCIDYFSVPNNLNRYK